jgi:hypothetical protein
MIGFLLILLAVCAFTGDDSDPSAWRGFGLLFSVFALFLIAVMKACF